ncbi:MULTISPECIES: DUF4177 domain-containing protein [unclassified Pseudoalteromonas]|uniref:DUF4177 domain-containing protein n=1 Tax=unclassified Pseudoalteromonas TaxID=194690 RepID=UPI000A7F3861|nr:MULTISPECIES: DUF4177 domain-containing protein [unclassified Pseudoalteromonas]
MQSKKALASALVIDILELEYKELPQMKKYEYKTLEIDNKEGFLTGLKKMPDLAEIFNKEGQKGWLVIQVLTPDLAQGR